VGDGRRGRRDAGDRGAGRVEPGLSAPVRRSVDGEGPLWTARVRRWRRPGRSPPSARRSVPAPGRWCAPRS
jgi:hypothetical protein